MVDWQGRALADRDDLRAVAPDALHVTLAFIGHRPVEEVEPIATVVEGALHGVQPAHLAPTAIQGVPRRRPRLFALDLADPDERAGTIHAAVSKALSDAGFYEPEKRKFWPHVTVARVRHAGKKTAPVTVPPPPDEFTATEVVLYRSHLGRGPARYEPLARFTL
jgi:2'-5' RNA ligase